MRAREEEGVARGLRAWPSSRIIRKSNWLLKTVKSSDKNENRPLT